MQERQGRREVQRFFFGSDNSFGVTVFSSKELNLWGRF